MKSSSFLPGQSQFRHAIANGEHGRVRGRMSMVTESQSPLTTERLANKSYQLEEDEDASSATTAMYLNGDGTISLGVTDGPEPDRIKASWKFNASDEEIELNIERYFEGEAGIEFMVKRVLRGHFNRTPQNSGELPIFTGAMYPFPTDFSKYSEVGYFAIILATDDLPTNDFDISKPA